MAKRDDNSKNAKSSFIRQLERNKRFLFIGIFLILSVVSVAFTTKRIFESDLTNWTITQGSYEAKNGELIARSPNQNWIYHNSSVAYGKWEWRFQYYGAYSASIIFIGIDPSPDYYSLASKGYKLSIIQGENLTLNKLTALNAAEELGSNFITLESNTWYTVKINRFTNNTFFVYVNNELLIKANDSDFITSEIFQLYWEQQQILDWVTVRDDQNEAASWEDYFDGLPNAGSDNIFTQISLFVPFISLTLVVLLYVFRLLFSGKSWTRLIIPLLLAVGLGFLYGYLIEKLRGIIPEPKPTITPSPTPTDTIPTSTIPTNGTGTGNETTPVPPPSDNIPGLNDGFPAFFNQGILSIILLVASGLFIIISVGIVILDFFRKQEETYHEKVITEDVRWLPKTTPEKHRERVIRAYHETSYDLIDKGAKNQRSMTPGEFYKEVTENFTIPSDTMKNITSLYEEARFSEHTITDSDSTKAERYYKEISEELTSKKESEKHKDKKNDSKEESNNGDTQL
ncbi:MAG: DUF4129 domain-containing protein [Asgard group archaeon]|nr:DUF4129 domain-containing protein [Asgard group archaeon]